MGDRFKVVAGIALWVVCSLGFLALAVIFIKGAMWASEHLLAPLFSVGSLAFALVLFLLLPLSMFKRLRGFTGICIFIASYLFGLTCWLLGFVITYALWGFGAILVGLLFLGGGVVPIGMIASIFNGEWQSLGMLLFLMGLTFGSRFLGVYIAQRAE